MPNKTVGDQFTQKPQVQFADPFADLGQSSDPFANFVHKQKIDQFANDPFAELNKR